MESDKLELSFPWFSNQYTIVMSFLTFLVFFLYMFYISYSQEDWGWLLLGLPALTMLPLRIFDFYLCIYKVPRIVKIRGDRIEIEMRTKQRFTISLYDIDRVEYVKRFLSWSPFDIKIFSSRLMREWLLSAQHMETSMPCS